MLGILKAFAIGIILGPFVWVAYMVASLGFIYGILSIRDGWISRKAGQPYLFEMAGGAGLIVAAIVCGLALQHFRLI